MKKVWMLDMSTKTFREFDTLEEAIAEASETAEIRVAGGKGKEYNPKHPNYRKEA